MLCALAAFLTTYAGAKPSLADETTATDSTENADIPSNERSRIINGVPARFDLNSWQVSILLKQNAEGGNFRKGHNCGGSMIRLRWVLTAAHCFYDKFRRPIEIDKLEVFAGHNRLPEPGVEIDESLYDTVKIKRVVIHESYRPEAAPYDIALMELERPVQRGTKINFVVPAKRKDVEAYEAVHIDAKVTGWGRTERGVKSSELLEANLEIVDRATCRDKYEKEGITRPGGPYQINDSMLCAGARAQGNEALVADSCGGDSGGPLLVTIGTKTRQVGIVSWGPRQCGRPGLFGVYTRVSDYEDWIKKVVSSN